MERAAAELEKKNGKRPQTEVDLRRILDDPEIDAVVIASCDHWHALATIWACQAGKHVYVEKPVCHNLLEGRKMLEAARKIRADRPNWDSAAFQRLLSQGGPTDPERGHRRRLLGQLRPAQSPGAHRIQAAGAGPLMARLGPVAGTRPNVPVPRQSGALQLTVVLGFRQRRAGDQRGSPAGHRPLVPGPGIACADPFGGRAVRHDQGETPNAQKVTFRYDDGTLLTGEVRNLYSARGRVRPRRPGGPDPRHRWLDEMSWSL